MKIIKSAASYLAVIFCGVSLAKNEPMHVTKDTTYENVFMAFPPYGDNRLIVDCKTVQPITVYTGIMVPFHTHFVISLLQDGRVGCRCRSLNRSLFRELNGIREEPLFIYVESYNCSAIVEYVKSLTNKYPLDKNQVLVFTVYPAIPHSKIEPHMKLYYELSTLFPELTTYIIIEANPEWNK